MFESSVGRRRPAQGRAQGPGQREPEEVARHPRREVLAGRYPGLGVLCGRLYALPRGIVDLGLFCEYRF